MLAVEHCCVVVIGAKIAAAVLLLLVRVPVAHVVVGHVAAVPAAARGAREGYKLSTPGAPWI